MERHNFTNKENIFSNENNELIRTVIRSLFIRKR